jgi:hypothetical protein
VVRALRLSLILAVACSREGALVISIPRAPATKPPACTLPPVKQPSDVGKTVELDDSSWTLLDASDIGNSIEPTARYAHGEHLETTGRFIQIRYRVVNRNTIGSVMFFWPKIVDDRGRMFGPPENEAEYVPIGTKIGVRATFHPLEDREFVTIIKIPCESVRLDVRFAGLGLWGTYANLKLAP